MLPALGWVPTSLSTVTTIVTSIGGDNVPATPVDLLMRIVARHGLPRGGDAAAAVSLCTPRAAWAHEAPNHVDRFQWTAFLSACEDHRLLGLLADTVRCGTIVLDEPQSEMLERRFRDWLVHDLAVEQVVCRAVEALELEGIEARVLKGVALANMVYPDPAWRVFGDIDLLVRSRDLGRAAHCLASVLGAERELPELRPGFDEQFGREVLMRCGAVEIDLHRTLVDGPFGLAVRLDDLFADPLRFTIGGRELLGLGTVQRFVHACHAAVLGDWPPRLIALRDIAMLLEGGERAGALDAVAVRALADRWRCAAVVALAVSRAVDELALEADHPLVPWARSFRPTLRDRVLLASYRGRARGYTSQAMSVAAIDGWRNRWAYLGAIVRPSREYLEARRFGRGDRLRKALGRRPGKQSRKQSAR